MKLRIRFSKRGKVRWTSHRDVARMWERALRRARLPVAYTAGFSPRPQLSFGLALPTGCESDAEYLDVALTAPVEAAGLAGALDPLLPEGVEVMAADTVAPGVPSLQEAVTSCSWTIEVPGTAAGDLAAAAGRVLGAEALPVERQRKGRDVVDDLRPSVLALSCAPGSTTTGTDPAGAVLHAELGTRPRGVRPSELARVMGLTFGTARRTCQWIERDGSRWEPLEADRVAVAPVTERVS